MNLQITKILGRLVSYTKIVNRLNLFSTNVPLLYPLKTSENRMFSDIFRGYRSGTLVENGLYFMAFFTDELFYGWGSTVSRLQIHYKETVYFLSISPQEFLVII